MALTFWPSPIVLCVHRCVVVLLNLHKNEQGYIFNSSRWDSGGKSRYGSTISVWDEEHGAEPRFLCFQEGRHHAGVFSWWEICGYRRGECLSRWWRPGDVEILCAKVSRGWRRLLSKTQRLIYTNNISATLKLSCSAHVLSHFMQLNNSIENTS